MRLYTLWPGQQLKPWALLAAPNWPIILDLNGSGSAPAYYVLEFLFWCGGLENRKQAKEN